MYFLHSVVEARPAGLAMSGTMNAPPRTVNAIVTGNVIVSVVGASDSIADPGVGLKLHLKNHGKKTLVQYFV